MIRNSLGPNQQTRRSFQYAVAPSINRFDFIDLRKLFKPEKLKCL